jgi:hypothetical protein
MRNLSLLPLLTYITFFLSAVRAFSVTVGTPTQCDNLLVTWTGKHMSRTYDVLLLSFIVIVRWTSAIRDRSDSCSLALLFQAYRWRANCMLPSSLSPCTIYLYQHQHSAMAKAHIQYRNSHLVPEQSFYSLCLMPPDLVQVGLQPS